MCLQSGSESTESHTQNLVHLCRAQMLQNKNSGGFSLIRGEANDKWKLQNCPMIFTLTVILIKLPSANDVSLSPPALVSTSSVSESLQVWEEAGAAFVASFADRVSASQVSSVSVQEKTYHFQTLKHFALPKYRKHKSFMKLFNTS